MASDARVDRHSERSWLAKSSSAGKTRDVSKVSADGGARESYDVPCTATTATGAATARWTSIKPVGTSGLEYFCLGREQRTDDRQPKYWGLSGIDSVVGIKSSLHREKM